MPRRCEIDLGANWSPPPDTDTRTFPHGKNGKWIRFHTRNEAELGAWILSRCVGQRSDVVHSTRQGPHRRLEQRNAGRCSRSAGHNGLHAVRTSAHRDAGRPIWAGRVPHEYRARGSTSSRCGPLDVAGDTAHGVSPCRANDIERSCSILDRPCVPLPTSG